MLPGGRLRVETLPLLRKQLGKIGLVGTLNKNATLCRKGQERMAAAPYMMCQTSCTIYYVSIFIKYDIITM